MKQISQACSAILFLLLCATLTYWGLFFLAPTSHKVALLNENEINEVSLSDAASLFGGSLQNESRLPLILRGVILSGIPSESIAILGVVGSPLRWLRSNTELMPGIVLQEIHAKHVIVLDHGWRREIVLSTFVSSTSTVNDMTRGVMLGSQRDTRRLVSPSAPVETNNANNSHLDAVKSADTKKP